MKNKKFMVMGFVSVAAVMSLAFSTTLFAKTEVSEEEAQASRLESLAKFTKVLSIVERYNVDSLTIEELMEKSLQGLMGNLDAHSTYLNKKHYDNLKVQTNGEFGGLGITVGMKDGALTVIAPLEDTPADRAGLKSGDIILKINDDSTLNMTIDEAVSIMRGEVGAPIDITIVRKDEPKPLEIHIIRDIIKIQSVYSKQIGDDILYLRVTSFDKKVVSDVKKEVKKHMTHDKGIVLDLRNNPGGLLDQAVGLVDLFVDEGEIVSQKGRDISEERSYKAKASTTITDTPIVVLVNGGSASASEIVSGARKTAYLGCWVWVVPNLLVGFQAVFHKLATITQPDNLDRPFFVRRFSTRINNTAGFTWDGSSYAIAYNVIFPSAGDPDLIVESITPNCGYLFGNESNDISAKIKNNGTGSAGAFNVSFEAGSFYKQVRVSGGLAAGADITVSVTDPTIRNAGSSVTIDVIADSNGEITESNEGNNASSKSETVVNNGYKGKTYTGGSNITTWKTFDLNGDLLYSTGDSQYMSGSGGWEHMIVTWTASDLLVPGTSAVKEARLYLPYTYAKDGAMPNNYLMEFNGNPVTFDVHYWDTKWYDRSYPYYGMLVYNVTTDFSTSGNTANFTSLWSGLPTHPGASMRGMVLAVIYEDSSASERKILINEEFDMLYGGTSKCTTPEEATAYAPFAGSIDLTKFKAGKLITMAPGAGPNEGELIFNGHTWTNVWNYAGSTQIGIDEHDVSSYLQSTNNEAGFQSSSDWMEASNAFLVLSIAEPDLIVESITPNLGYLFGNESNEISAKIKNNGTASAVAFNVSFEAGSFYKQVTVSGGLAAGADITVSVTDPTIRNAGSSVTIDVIADCNGEITESNEGNNASSRTETVLNNGYKGKTYTGGSNISTWKTFELNGDLLYSIGDSYYLSASVVPDWTSYDINWAASELPVPGTATVREARLYIPYTWAKPGLMPDYMSLTFNGNSEPLDKHYWDKKGWGSYADNQYGMLVYNVTANFSTGGNVANLINSYPGGGKVSMRGMVLAVIYEDSNAWEKKILINEEFDQLYGGTSKCTTPEEATAYAPFAGSIDLTKYEWGKLITMAPGAGPNEGELIFNGNTWTNVWNFAGSTQIGIDEHDVSSYLQSTNNEAGFQSSNDYMEASNAFLVLTSSIEIDLGPWQDTEVGRHIMVPITANSLDKFYGTVEMNLSYEASKFDFVAVHSSSDSIVTAYQDYPTLGILDISAWNQNGVKGDVVLATVELEVVDGAGSNEELSLTVDVFEDIYGTSIKADLIPTTISIKDPTNELSVTLASSAPQSDLGDANKGILNDNGRPRHTGDNETVISAVVTDAGLGIDAVTVDLSAICGSANTLMSETSPGSGTYTVTTTATAGIDGTHTFVVTATDNGGNTATGTTNVLTVYRRGDVMRNDMVDMGDALYIARYTVGLESPDMDHFKFVGDVQPADGGDEHLTNMGDALFIARHTVGLEPAP